MGPLFPSSDPERRCERAKPAPLSWFLIEARAPIDHRQVWSDDASFEMRTAQGLQNFKQITDGLKYNIGGVRDQFYAMAADPTGFKKRQ